MPAGQIGLAGLKAEQSPGARDADRPAGAPHRVPQERLGAGYHRPAADRSLQLLNNLGPAQRVLSVHNHFNQDRHLISRENYKERRSAALAEWQAVMA